MLKDLRLAFRQLAQSPIVTAVAIASLALGIGANSSIFSIVNAFVFPQLPYEDPDALYSLSETDQKRSQRRTAVTPADYTDWQERQTVFQELAVFTREDVKITGDGDPEQVVAARVSAEFFTLLGTGAGVGRVFAAGDDGTGSDRLLILSHFLWQRRWGGDPGVVGRMVEIDDVPHTIVGVLPDAFEFGNALTAVWRPLVLDAEARQDRENHRLSVIGRLKDGVTGEKAQEEMEAMAARIEAEHPETNEGHGARVMLLADEMMDESDQMLASMIMALVGFVLMIACANIANLLLARGEGRRKEIAVRAALGAGKGRLIRQVMTESVLLALIGGALGFLGAVGGVRSLAAIMPPEMPKTFVPALDGRVVLFTAAVSVFAGLLFGLLPALAAARTDLNGTLRDGGRDSVPLGGFKGGRYSGPSQRGWLRNGLVVGQVGLAVMLLVGAGVMARTFRHLQPSDPGFNSDQLMTVNVALPESADDERRVTFFERTAEEMREVPGIVAVTPMSDLPRSRGGASRAQYTVPGETYEEGQEPSSMWLTVGPEYFSTLEIPMTRGRAFSDIDRADTSAVAIVNRRFAEKHWPDGNALGQRFDVHGKSWEIVGISQNIYQRRIVDILGGAEPAIYLPYRQHPVRRMHFVAKTRSEPDAFAGELRAAVWRVEVGQPVGSVKSMDEHIREMLAGPSSISAIVLGLAVLAVGLAALGIYGVMAYSVSLRRREIGIRMALGARGGSIRRLITRQGFVLLAIGFAVAGPGVWGVLRALHGFFGVLKGDAIGFSVGMLATLLTIGLLASYVPARSAAAVSPSETLRS